jgi:hypothetical protein
MNDEAPRSFLSAMEDFSKGKTYPITDMQFESADYNRGYIDGVNQARKEARKEASKK